MIKISAFAGSNSTQSINKQLVSYTAQLFNNDDTTILDLNDFDIPLYSYDLEEASGVPEHVVKFSAIIRDSDLLIISLAEHNGAYSAVFKNLFDWLSRVSDTKGFYNKPIFLMATSPGARGGSSVLEMAQNRFPYNDGVIIDTFSLPNFGSNFDLNKGIINNELKQQLLDKVIAIKKQLNNN